MQLKISEDQNCNILKNYVMITKNKLSDKKNPNNKKISNLTILIYEVFLCSIFLKKCRANTKEWDEPSEYDDIYVFPDKEKDKDKEKEKEKEKKKEVAPNESNKEQEVSAGTAENEKSQPQQISEGT
ncbi:hypothetical protein RFI_31608 [Reticulomyxa filosa]|uniref:Uncharacterized protein n=1 Tax=Reticulomyxa filosa TaxID=46433 RepID=X6LYI1_RETFI|nr:hypothetical protein RFI_31608 [Reticulomyxa filosa]|eukprot:ETO05790.1 hypothetical protein RFI_31608 [Reticulomyxa filosa]